MVKILYRAVEHFEMLFGRINHPEAQMTNQRVARSRCYFEWIVAVDLGRTSFAWLRGVNDDILEGEVLTVNDELRKTITAADVEYPLDASFQAVLKNQFVVKIVGTANIIHQLQSSHNLVVKRRVYGAKFVIWADGLQVFVEPICHDFGKFCVVNFFIIKI